MLSRGIVGLTEGDNYQDKGIERVNFGENDLRFDFAIFQGTVSRFIPLHLMHFI